MEPDQPAETAPADNQPAFDPAAWEMHVAGCAVADEPDMLLIVGMLARMAGPDGEIVLDPAAYPDGSQEQYLAALLTEMAAEDAAAGRPYTGWRLAYGHPSNDTD